MAFEENRILFGHDGEERLVAVELAGPAEVELFTRGENGGISRRREPFKPFCWTAGSLASEGGVSMTDLSGSLALGFLAEAETWADFSRLKSALKETGMPHFVLGDAPLQYLMRSGKTLFKGMRPEELRRLQLAVIEGNEGTVARVEVEVAGIGWRGFDAESLGEKGLLEALSQFVEEVDPDVIEGHDILRGGLTRLLARAKKLKVKLLWGRDGSPLSSRSSRVQIAEKTFFYPKFTAYGRHFVDTFFLAQLWDVSARELEGETLEEVAEHFHIEGTLPAKARGLVEVLGGSYFTQAQIFPYPYQDSVLRGNATKINSLFLREYLRQGHSIPLPPEVRSFEGGFTDVFETGVIENVWHCDVASLYPSVILKYGCFPQGDVLAIFEHLLRDLRIFRLEAKGALRNAVTREDRDYYGALQAAFKILINSFYGYLGFAQGHFADYDAASRVTEKGRELLRQMMEWLRAEGATLVEADTDGIYFTPPKEGSIETLQEGLKRALPEGIDVEFDAQYPAMYSYKAKNYALLTSEGEVILRGGALRSRGMERYLRRFLEEMLRLILEGRRGEISSLYETYEKALREGAWGIEELMKSDALQDSLVQYRKKIEAGSRNRSAPYELALKSGKMHQPGDKVRYYITGEKAKVAAYENSRLVEEWDSTKRDENVAYYVAKLRELVKRFENG